MNIYIGLEVYKKIQVEWFCGAAAYLCDLVSQLVIAHVAAAKATQATSLGNGDHHLRRCFATLGASSNACSISSLSIKSVRGHMRSLLRSKSFVAICGFALERNARCFHSGMLPRRDLLFGRA
jgi:hypothetical protein